MTLFAIFEPEPGKSRVPVAIPERFSWFAAILPPLYALAHGLWLELVGYVVVVAGLVLAGPYIGDDAAFWLYVLFAAWIGFAAPSIRRHAFAWRGWRHRRDLVAADSDLARLTWMEKY